MAGRMQAAWLRLRRARANRLDVAFTGEGMAEREGARFKAFLSYSHRDAAWAEWLHRALERYRTPRELAGRATAGGAIPARIFPVFRDRDELPASTDLKSSIREALERSDNLVVLCSPRSAASRWVNEEILAWKRLGREGRVFAFIVDGEPNADDPSQECFPPALRFRLAADGSLGDEPAEPVAADARDGGDGRDHARLKLIAGLLGVGLDALKRRELHAQRRRMAVAYGLAAIFALAAFAAIWFAIMAERERARAQANLEAAVDAANVMVFDVAQASKTAIGAQQRVLGDILRRADALLQALAAEQNLPPSARNAFGAAQMELSMSLLAAGDSAGALAAADKAVATMSDLAAAVADDPYYETALGGALVAQGDARRAQGDFDGAREAYGAAFTRFGQVAAKAPDDPAARAALGHAHLKRGELAETTGDLDAAFADYDAARRIFAARVAKDPGDISAAQNLAIALDRIGDWRMKRNRVPDASASYEEAAPLFRKVSEAAPENAIRRHDLAAALIKVGDIRMRAGDGASALTLFREALGVLTGLAMSDPGNAVFARAAATAHERVADALTLLGRADEAAADYDASLAARAPLLEADPANASLRQDMAIAHERVGLSRIQRGDAPGAVAAYEQALALRESLAASRDADATIGLGNTLLMLGMLKSGLGESAAAEIYLRRAVEVAERAVSEAPEDARGARLKALTQSAQGDLKRAANDVPGALALYESAIAGLRAVAASNPDDLDARAALTPLMLKAAELHVKAGEGLKALMLFNDAVALAAELTRRQPGNLAHWRALSNAHLALAATYEKIDSPSQALAHLHMALGALESLAGRSVDAAAATAEMMNLLFRIGALQEKSGDNEGARASYARAVGLGEGLRRAAPEDAGAATLLERAREALRQSGG